MELPCLLLAKQPVQHNTTLTGSTHTAIEHQRSSWPLLFPKVTLQCLLSQHNIIGYLKRVEFSQDNTSSKNSSYT